MGSTDRQRPEEAERWVDICSVLSHASKLRCSIDSIPGVSQGGCRVNTLLIDLLSAVSV